MIFVEASEDETRTMCSAQWKLPFDIWRDMMLRKLDSIQKWLFYHMLSTAGHFMAWSGHGQDI